MAAKHEHRQNIEEASRKSISLVVPKEVVVILRGGLSIAIHLKELNPLRYINVSPSVTSIL